MIQEQEALVEGLSITLARLQPEEGDFIVVKASPSITQEVEVAIAEAMYTALAIAGYEKVPVVLAPYELDFAVVTRAEARETAQKLLAQLDSGLSDLLK